MYTKKLCIVIIMILAIGLTGCLGSNELQPFPTCFVRESDGARLWLGMTASEVVHDFEYREEFIGATFSLNDVGEVVIVSVTTDCWTLAGGISVGDNIQSIIVDNHFLHTLHYVEYRSFNFTDVAPDESTYWGTLYYDEDGIITNIRLAYMPGVRIWQQQQEEQPLL